MNMRSKNADSFRDQMARSMGELRSIINAAQSPDGDGKFVARRARARLKGKAEIGAMTETTTKPSRITACSFCGKTNAQSGPHAEGPGGVYICEDCAYIALGICRNEKAKLSANRSNSAR